MIKKEITEYNLNVFDEIGNKWGIVTGGDKTTGFNCLTVSWGGFGVIWGKNVAYLFVRESRYTKELMDAGNFFSVAFLNEEYREQLKYCGVHSGREGDKFKASGLTLAAKHGIPYPDEANLVLLCQKMATVPVTREMFDVPEIYEKWYKDEDYHTMYVGEIIEVLTR